MLSRSVRLTVAAAVSVAGLVLGTTAPADASASCHHRLGHTRVVVAPEVYQLIASAGITPAPLGPAKAYAFKDTLAASFPISGINVAKLRIRHVGGLSLSAGDANISLRRFTIDLARLRVSARVSGSATGDVGRVDLFKIRFSDRPSYGLVRLTLTDTAASALNATFGVDAFAEDATFGYATPFVHVGAGKRAASLAHALQR